MSDIGDFKNMVGAFVGAQGATTAASEQAGCGCCTDLRQPPASEQQASVSELPPLPEPTVFKNEGTVYGYEVRAFTLDQMQGYARAALSGRATIPSEADELAPVSFDTWFDDMPEKERMRILLSGDRMVALNAWRAALTHRATTATPGYKLVPVRLTNEMRTAARDKLGFTQMYEAAIAAAPDTATTAADQQTERKTLQLGEGMARTGYILQDDTGRACIVHQGAVRWLSNAELWNVVHPAADQQGDTASANRNYDCYNCGGKESAHNEGCPALAQQGAAQAQAGDARDAGALEIACVINKKLGDVLAGRAYLLPADLAALKRFYECATDFDSGGHDVPKTIMARLQEIGVVRPIGFGRHQTTAFGDYVIERNEGEPVKLPLKTLHERNEDSRAGAIDHAAMAAPATSKEPQ